ncbi:MAG TPA: hypothetical protein VN638_02985 [Nitrospiraceae bacterium]|nr:hypothetical protein [Nitrospiraceae bacterium]
MTSIQVLATPMMGRDKSSSVNPTAFNIARAGARSGPTSNLWLVSFNSFGIIAYFPFVVPFFLPSAFWSFFISMSIIRYCGKPVVNRLAPLTINVPHEYA